MSEVLKIQEGKSVLVIGGLRFVTLLSVGSAREGIAEAKKIFGGEYSSVGVVASNTDKGVSVAGLCQHDNSKESVGKLSLSCLFAAFVRGRGADNAIFISSHEGVVVLSVVNNGVPTEELTGGHDEIVAVANEVYAQFPTGCLIYGDRSLFDGANALSVADIIDSVDAKTLKHCLVTNHGTPFVLKAGIGILLLAVAAGGGWWKYDQNVMAKKRAIALAEEAQIKNSPIAVFQRLHDEAVAVESNLCGDEDVAIFVKKTWAMPTYVAGWVMSDVVFSCSTDGARTIKSSWKRENGENSSLSKAFPNLPLRFGTDLSSAEISIPVSTLSAQGQKDSVNSLSQSNLIPDFYKFMRVYGTILQRMNRVGIGVSLGAPAPLAGQPTPLDYTEIVLMKGSLTLSGEGRFLGAGFSRVSSIVRVKKIQIVFSKGEPSFNLEGNYYVKTNENSAAGISN